MNTINVTQNYVLNLRTKYIKVKNHFIEERLKKGDVSLELVPTATKNNVYAHTYLAKLKEVWEGKS